MQQTAPSLLPNRPEGFNPRKIIVLGLILIAFVMVVVFIWRSPSEKEKYKARLMKAAAETQQVSIQQRDDKPVLSAIEDLGNTLGGRLEDIEARVKELEERARPNVGLASLLELKSQGFTPREIKLARAALGLPENLVDDQVDEEVGAKMAQLQAKTEAAAAARKAAEGQLADAAKAEAEATVGRGDLEEFARSLGLTLEEPPTVVVPTPGKT